MSIYTQQCFRKFHHVVRSSLGTVRYVVRYIFYSCACARSETLNSRFLQIGSFSIKDGNGNDNAINYEFDWSSVEK